MNANQSIINKIRLRYILPSMILSLLFCFLDSYIYSNNTVNFIISKKTAYQSEVIYWLEKLWTVIIHPQPEWTAIIVALVLGTGIIQDKVRRWRYKPKLKVTCTPSPPDCHKTSITDKKTGEFICDCYYLRLNIENIGNTSMDEVEVKMLSVSKKIGDHYEMQNSFLPMNLKWSHTGDVIASKIQTGLFKHLDLGNVRKHFDQLPIEKKQVKSEIALFCDLEVIPNTGSHIILHGDYKIKLVIAGNNLKPQYKEYNLVLMDKWTEDEAAMLSKNITLKELS